MFKRKTVFIVGAGASTEVGLPMGAQLKDQIAGKLRIMFNLNGGLNSGDRKIADALRLYCREPDGRWATIEPYCCAAVQIAESMPLSISIDNYLDAHSGDEKIGICGKLAIAACILGPVSS